MDNCATGTWEQSTPLNTEYWPDPLPPRAQQGFLLPPPRTWHTGHNNTPQRPQLLRGEVLADHTTEVNFPIVEQYAPPQHRLNAPFPLSPNFTSYNGPYPASSQDDLGPIHPANADIAACVPSHQPDVYHLIYQKYRHLLLETNTNMVSGRLVEASESLLKCSQLLLSKARFLRLTEDDQNLYHERLRLWNDFNNCWLAFATRQLDESRRVRDSGQASPQGQSILSRSAVKELGDELIELCDSLQKTGLIDYEMGVWEEEIMKIFSQCWETAVEKTRLPQ